MRAECSYDFGEQICDRLETEHLATLVRPSLTRLLAYNCNYTPQRRQMDVTLQLQSSAAHYDVQ